MTQKLTAYNIKERKNKIKKKHEDIRDLRESERGFVTIRELEMKANEIRRGIIDLIHASQVGHVGGALSSCDILTALYYEIMNIDATMVDDDNRDRFVLSKGHCVEGYLNILADKGFFEKEELKSFCAFQTQLIAHPNRQIPGVEMNTGALGHGLAIACGMAKAAKMQEKSYRVFVVMGDGEQAEGAIWEAAMFASNYALDNLYAIVDRNHLQISGPTEDVMQLEPLRQKWEAFGFYVEQVDGNDMRAVVNALYKMQSVQGKPKLLLADTVKGKGVSFMENQTKWHHGGLNDALYAMACEEITRRAEALRNE